MEDDYIKTEIKKYSGDYGVFFSIGHQTFKLDIPEDDEMTSLEYAKWYQRQLDAAFDRIKERFKCLDNLVESAIMKVDGFAEWYLREEGYTDADFEKVRKDAMALIKSLKEKAKKGKDETTDRLPGV